MALSLPARGSYPTIAAPRPDPVPEAAGSASAHVVAVDPVLMVRVGGAVLAARRAVSCLVAPRPEDHVLVATVDGACFVLAILERPDGAALVLDAPEDADIELRARDLRLTGSRAIAVTAPDIAVEAGSARLIAGAATLLGRLMTVVGERLRTSVGRQEVTADHLAQRLGERVTIVDGADVTETASSHTRVDGTMTTAVGSAVTTATRDLRFDAERVSVG